MISRSACGDTIIPKKPSTKRIATIKTPNTPYYVEEQLLEQNSFLFSTSIELSVNKIKQDTLSEEEQDDAKTRTTVQIWMTQKNFPLKQQEY